MSKKPAGNRPFPGRQRGLHRARQVRHGGEDPRRDLRERHDPRPARFVTSSNVKEGIAAARPSASARRQGQGHGHPQHPVQPPDPRQHLHQDDQGRVPRHPGRSRVFTQQDDQPRPTRPSCRRRPEVSRSRRGVLPEGPSGRGAARQQSSRRAAAAEDQGHLLRHGRRHPRSSSRKAR